MPRVNLRVLLLSAYEAVSHRQWAQRVQLMLPQWQWQVLTLPARHFSWRVRGSSLYWSQAQRSTLEQNYDLVLATSMVDLATLRGLVPHLATIPCAVYFHENQFTYPRGSSRHPLLEAQITSLYSALASDLLLFNSAHNRDTFLDGVDAMLRQFPDAVPPGIVAQLTQRCELLPVPIASGAAALAPGDFSTGLQLLWNHRWEYDKGPQQLLAAVRCIEALGLPVQLHVVGQVFRQQPEAFAQLRALLDDTTCVQLGQWGYVENDGEYQALLQRCDVVLSTALHDFQGLAILQAVAAGCVPLVPDRLAYPELFAPAYLYRSDLQQPQCEAQSLAGTLQGWMAAARSGSPPAVPDVSAWTMAGLKSRYAELLEAVARSHGGGESV